MFNIIWQPTPTISPFYGNVNQDLIPLRFSQHLPRSPEGRQGVLRLLGDHSRLATTCATDCWTCPV